jgi:hypothetical protein
MAYEQGEVYMPLETIDGYEVIVSESSQLLTEIEETALLLLDPSYFGEVPQTQALNAGDVDALFMLLSDKLDGRSRLGADPPSAHLVNAAANLRFANLVSILRRLADRWGPGRLVRLRSGDFYSGTALNYFSALLADFERRADVE